MIRYQKLCESFISMENLFCDVDNSEFAHGRFCLLKRCLKREKIISVFSSDYNMFKSELNNMENFYECEVIDLLPDLNSVVRFEDTNISDILSLMDTNIVQETDDSLVDVNKDPAIDPLFINNCEERDADTTLMDSKSQSSVSSTRKINLCWYQTN